MPAQWQTQPKRWRVQGKAPDGLTVTLGRYDTEDEANAECAKFVREGQYRDVRVAPIAPARDPLPPR
jgi:hypothetical protein